MQDEYILTLFWSRVDKSGPIPTHLPAFGPCWLWTGPRTADGYGQAGGGGKALKGYRTAHRRSWLIHFGLIPDGLKVLHRCDSPPCVRPDHLFLGTLADNVHDMIEKGRDRPACGESSGLSRLTDEVVTTIRKQFQSGGARITDLAEQHGLTKGHVSKIVHRKLWQHIP